MTDSIASRVSQIIADEFSIDPSEITEETVAADVDGWDSLRHVMILAAIEADFSVKFKTADIMKIECVGDIMKLVESKA